MKIIKIDFSPFEYGVTVCIGDYKEFSKYIKRKTGKTTDSGPYGSLGQCAHVKDWCPFIWIPRKPKTAREVGTLAHEAVHAGLWLLDWVGANAEVGNDEFFGHIVGYIVTQVLSKA